MKSIYTILTLLVTLSVFSQSAISLEVGDFNEVKVYDLIEINLIPSSENKVIIKGDDTHFVKVVNKNGKLKIKMDLEKSFNGDQTFVEVYFKDLDIIDSNEGAYVVVNEMIEQNTIELRAQEGGRIRVGLEVNHLKIKSVTGGIVEASGLAKSQEIKLNTGGIFEGRELRTMDTKLAITAAGEAEINASESVDVKLTAGGDVYIYGDPKKIQKRRLAGGRIKVMN